MVIRTNMPDVVCDFEAPRDASAANTSPALAAVPVIEATEPARIGALWSENRPIYYADFSWRRLLKGKIAGSAPSVTTAFDIFTIP